MNSGRTYVRYHQRHATKAAFGSKAVRRFQKAYQKQDATALEAVDELGLERNLSYEMYRLQLELLAERYLELQAECCA